MSMVHSAETRWFVRSTLDPDLVAWFSSGPQKPKLEPPRPDDYLRLANCDTVGVKMRDGRKLEIKAQVSAPKLFDRGHVRGRIDEWIKWSFEDPALPPAAKAMMAAEPWMKITKSRYLRK